MRLRQLFQLLQRGGDGGFIPARAARILARHLDGDMHLAARRDLAHRLADRRLVGLPFIGQR